MIDRFEGMSTKTKVKILVVFIIIVAIIFIKINTLSHDKNISELTQLIEKSGVILPDSDPNAFTTKKNSLYKEQIVRNLLEVSRERGNPLYPINSCVIYESKETEVLDYLDFKLIESDFKTVFYLVDMGFLKKPKWKAEKELMRCPE